MIQNYMLKQNLNNGYKIINFMRLNYLAFTISSFLCILSIIIILLNGFNWGLDFTGGTIIEINFHQVPNLNKIRNILMNNGYQEALIQSFDSNKNIMIRLPASKDLTSKEVGKSIISLINKGINNQPIVNRIEFVGPTIGSELAESGVIALLAALICILIYIAFRFEWCLAISTVISLVHDIFITLGIVSFFQVEVDMSIIASLMSVIGYSLNDSIVISDRIRENFRKIPQCNSYEILNISLTQTLTRTFITSGISLLVIVMLYLFGGQIVKGFSLVMLVGIIIGTFSSIYIVSALALKMGIKREYLIPLDIEKENRD